jgi:PAS domain S-box-containing protein
VSEFALDPELLADAGLGLVVYASSAEARILCCNALAAGWFGGTRAALEGRAALDADWSFIDEHEQPLRQEDLPMFAALASGQPIRNVTLGILAAGHTSPVWVRAGAVPQRGDGGAIQRVVMTLTDVTAEVNSRQAPTLMDRLMKVAFESAHDGLFFCNADGSVIKFNAVYGQLSRISPTDRITSLAELRRVVSGMDASGAPLALEDWPVKRALRGETGELEATAHRPGIDNAWIGIYRYSPLRDADGAILGAVVVCRDVTRKRRLERKLRQSEHRLRALVDGAPDGIFIRTKGVFTYVNAALLKTLGLTGPSEFLGSTSLDWVAPEYTEARQRMEQGVEEGHSVPPSFRELLRRDGSRIPVETAGAMLDLDSYAGFVRDVSARVAAEAQERQLRDELERTRRMESIGQLAAGLAHDFNNILQAQKLFLALLKRKLSTHVEVAQDLGNIESCTDKAGGLISNLLAFGRKQVGQPQRVDLNLVLLRMGELLKSSAGEHIDFQITPAPAALWVNLDPGHLDQIMLNLVLNARDAMPDGGELRIQMADETDPASGRAWARLSVIDTGIGIEAQALERVFEPFFSTKLEGPNCGLGLASVHGLVHQNHGEIAVRSRVGVGTQFDIRLPLADAGPQPQPSVAEREFPADCPFRRVLLVEDDELLRKVTKLMLEAEGHEVREAASGPAALALLEQQTFFPQLLITDLVMPGMNGCALADRVRERCGELPVIVVSGHPKGVVGRDGELAAGINFLSKPFSAEQLQRMIASLEDKR